MVVMSSAVMLMLHRLRMLVPAGYNVKSISAAHNEVTYFFPLQRPPSQTKNEVMDQGKNFDIDPGNF